MPEVKYERDTNLFDSNGLDLNRPVDSVKPKKFPYLKNCRSYVDGRLEPRLGLTDIAAVVAGQSPVHSARRLNDPANSAYARIIGAGTHLAYGTASFTDADSGYSGDPLALVPWKPDASPTPYMYVADRSRMRKITRAGALDTIGYAPPTTAPTVALTNFPSYPYRRIIDEFDATTGWGQSGTAGAPTLISAGPGYRTNSTITYILYDTGTTGWANVNLASMVGVGYAEALDFNPGGGTDEIVPVQKVLAGSVATTISRVIYDSGTTGLCSLVLATPIDQVAIDAMIRNATVGPENARIIAVVPGPNGLTSIRLSTTNTWAAGNTVQIIATFRVYLYNNHAAGETVRTDGMRSVITVGNGFLSKTAALDVSTIDTGIPALPDDYMHIAFRADRPDLITELKVQLDVDSATNDFTRNFYTRSFRASDLTPSVRNQQPIVATNSTILQRTILDGSGNASAFNQSELPSGNASPFVPKGIPSFIEGPQGVGSDLAPAPAGSSGSSQRLLRDDVTTPAESPIVYSQQLESGDVQWTDLAFRLSDLIRVGTDDTRSLQNVAAIRIVAIVTGTVTLDMDSWWVGGGYGPDSGDVTATPYLYRYRVRNPATNVASNFSPAARYQASPLRQSVTVTPTQYAAPSGTSLSATDLVLDIERFGGQIADWHYVGTTANSASPSFADIYADDIVGGNPIIPNDNYQPWPIIGTPVSGTTGTVAGSTVNDTTTNFNTSWAPGTRILINNVPFTLYRVISTSRLELVENAGSQTGVAWRIDEPTILAQPLACLWEWDNVFFACADPTNPGRLYHSNPNSETTTPTNYLDLTSPSEPLMNGLQFNVRSYVFSSENFIQILKTGDPNRPFTHENIPNGKGLFSRWGFTREPGPFIDFVAKDGIYRTVGGAPLNLTDIDLYPLFPNEGNLGGDVNGVLSPNIVAAQAVYLRLAYYDGYTYFDYAAQSGGYATLVITSDASNSPVGWLWDVYTPRVIFHYGEEGAGVHSLLCGTTDTHLYQYAGYSDNGTAFSMEFTTPSRDQGDSRLNKLYGDIMLDADTQSLDVACTPYFNNNAASTAAITVNTASRLQTPIVFGTLPNNSWYTARNISLNCVVSISTSARPKFYIWEPRWTFESAPISAYAWEISPTTFGMENFKSIGICKVTHVSSADLVLTFTVDGVTTTVTITNSASMYSQTIFRVPVLKGKLYKLRLSSLTPFRLDPRDTFIEVKDWASDGAYQKLRVFGDFSLVEG